MKGFAFLFLEREARHIQSKARCVRVRGRRCMHEAEHAVRVCRDAAAQPVHEQAPSPHWTIAQACRL